MVNKKYAFTKRSIFECVFTVLNKETGRENELHMFVEATDVDKARSHMFASTENNLYRITQYQIHERTLWKAKQNGIPFSDLMPVICISERKGFPQSGVKGEKYFIQRSSIYMDPDGTVYGQLFEDNKGTVVLSHVRLDRFMSI